MRGGYYGAVTFMDSQLGVILDALEENGFMEDTVIVFWGDHGYHLGEQGTWCKITAFELAARVPLIVRIPGVNEGMSSTALVELLSFFRFLFRLKKSKFRICTK